MRITRVYTDQPLESGAEVELGRDAARHLMAVLRIKVGEPVTLFNGRGGEYLGELVRYDKKSLAVRLREFDDRECESPLAIHLGIGISRGEKMDFIIQKATELGVTSIAPLFTDRSEVKLTGDRAGKRLHHWRRVAVSACEQCGRNRIPSVAKPQASEDWQQSVEAGSKLVLDHRCKTPLAVLQRQNSPQSIALLIGPEGGLSTQEITAAGQRGFQPLALGPRVLRTETAPLAAISILQNIWGDLA